MRPSILEFLRGHDLEVLALLFPTKGVIYAVAMAAVVFLFLRRCRQTELPLDRALPATAISALAGIMGARIYHLLSADGLALEPLALITSSGVGSWGACIGGLLGMVLYFGLVKANPLPYLDVAAGVAPLAPLIARWGCLLAGCDFGRVTSLPWGIHYPIGSQVFHEHVASGVVSPDSAQSLAVHPLPAYLSLNALLLFLIVSAVWHRTRHRPGTTLTVACVLYGSTRFFWEFLRDPAVGGTVSGLSLLQITALVGIGIGGVSGVMTLRRGVAQSGATNELRL